MIRVLLVDDQALVRSGIRIILDSEPGIEVVGEAENGAEGVALALELQPDVICMDVEMPTVDGVTNGIDASRRILADVPAQGTAPAILVLTTFGHEEYLFDALAAGVDGFLLKTSRAEQLIDAVRVLAGGGSLLGPEVTGAVLSRVRSNAAVAAVPVPVPVPPASGPVPPVSAPQSSASSSEQAPAPQTSSEALLKAAAQAASHALESAIAEVGLTAREQAVFALLAEGRTNAEIAAELFLGEATVKTHMSNVLQKLGVRDRLQAVVWAHTRS